VPPQPLQQQQQQAVIKLFFFIYFAVLLLRIFVAGVLSNEVLRKPIARVFSDRIVAGQNVKTT
jgi:hypothetical protein